jgi:GntR family transcriptional regulator
MSDLSTVPGSSDRSDAALMRHLPAYARLRTALLDLMENGNWKPGDRLPSELQLGARFQVSLGTVRKALENLADEGALLRRQGLGTFVASTRLVEADLRYYRFARDPQGPLATVAIKALGIRRVARPSVAAFLGADAHGYVLVRRLITIDACSPIYSESYLPGSRFADLVGTPPSALDGTTLYSYLEKHFGTPTLSNEHFFSVISFPRTVRVTLREPRTVVGCLWEFVARTYRDKAIEYRRSYLREMPLRLRFGVTRF